jgi:hypothetical protein
MDGETDGTAMTSFLFWNIHRKPLEAAIERLARLHKPDVIMLAECDIPAGQLLSCLNRARRDEYDYVPQADCRAIHIFTRFPSKWLPSVKDVERLTIRRLQLPGIQEILLAVTHFPSKMHWSERSQNSQMHVLARKIREAEDKEQNFRTVLVGDLNMNPFESGLVDANGLHGVMIRSVALRGSRRVQGDRYPFFYNPMWSLFGDASRGAPGTFYQWRSEPTVYFWNMFDQVLIRPALLDRFRTEDLHILETDGLLSLRRGAHMAPDKGRASDHLPLFFKLDL